MLILFWEPFVTLFINYCNKILDPSLPDDQEIIYERPLSNNFLLVFIQTSYYFNEVQCSIFFSFFQIIGEKDADGFYWGECGNRSGYVPCNMVSEVQVKKSKIIWVEKQFGKK